MTRLECRDALHGWAREAVLLVVIAQLADAIRATCAPRALLACEWALDVARRAQLGQVDKSEVLASWSAVEDACQSAADAAPAMLTSSAEWWAASAADAIVSVALRRPVPCVDVCEKLAVSAIDSVGAATALVAGEPIAEPLEAFRRVVEALSSAPTVWESVVVTAAGSVLTPEAAWLRERELGGRWVKRVSLSPAEQVRLDVELADDAV